MRVWGKAGILVREIRGIYGSLSFSDPFPCPEFFLVLLFRLRFSAKNIIKHHFSTHFSAVFRARLCPFGGGVAALLPRIIEIQGPGDTCSCVL